MKEDVTQIVLNVKKIIAKLHCTGTKRVYIQASGEGKVTAGDIKADSEVEILNPDLHIATLGPDATLSMELTLSHGRGYVTADKNKAPQQVIGTIPVDSFYSPVSKVNYTVDNTRVVNMTDYDKLTIEVFTNKTISAKDAVSLSAKILTDHLPLQNSRLLGICSHEGALIVALNYRVRHLAVEKYNGIILEKARVHILSLSCAET